MFVYKVSENNIKICGNDAKSRDLSTTGCQSLVRLMDQEIGWSWSDLYRSLCVCCGEKILMFLQVNS